MMKPKLPTDDGGFSAWYAIYPRKVGRGHAQKAYRSALKKTDPETLMAGVVRYTAEVANKAQGFIKHPGTWLNAECWADEGDESLENLMGRLEVRVKEVIPRDHKRALANLLMTYGKNVERALERLELVAREKYPEYELNEWMWKHGPPGVSVGLMGPNS